MPKKNPLRRKPRKEKALQRQQQRQSVRQNVVVNLAMPRVRSGRRSGGGAIRQARITTIPETIYRFRQTINLPQTYPAEDLPAPSPLMSNQRESQQKLEKHQNRVSFATQTSYDALNDLHKRQEADAEVAASKRAISVNAMSGEIAAPELAAPELVAANNTDLAVGPEVPDPVFYNAGDEAPPVQTPAKRVRRNKAQMEEARAADAAAKEQKKLAMAEMVSRDKQGKQYEELGSSASAFGGRSGVSESSDKSARLMAQVAALGSPPLWNEGLGSMLVAGKTNLKKTPPPAVSDTSTRMSAFSRGGGGSSTGTTLNYRNPLMNTRNPMLDNPMFKLRQRMEAEDNSSGF